MTSALLFRWQLTLRAGLYSAVATFAVVGCTKIHYLYPKNMQGYVLPEGCPIGTAPTNATQLNACLAGVEFDTAEFVGDEQRLMVRESTPEGPRCHGSPLFACSYGPLAKIEPVKGAEMYSADAMAQGRIIARMYLRPMETDSYPKLGLVPNDTTYWWVRSPQDTSVFIRRVMGISTLAVKERGLTRTPHAKGAFQQATARWVWDPADEKANGACGSSCCKPN